MVTVGEAVHVFRQRVRESSTFCSILLWPITALKNSLFQKPFKSSAFLTVMWLFTLDILLVFLFSLSCSPLLLLIKCNRKKKWKAITHDSFYLNVAGIFRFLCITFVCYLQTAYFTQLTSSINYNLWVFSATWNCITNSCLSFVFITTIFHSCVISHYVNVP